MKLKTDKLIPPADGVLKKKCIFLRKKEPVWTYLEREMRQLEEAGKKPYNEKVGIWLRFMRDLKRHYYEEAENYYNKLQNQAGPKWFFQLSPKQIEILDNLGKQLNQDRIAQRPWRTQAVLNKYGIVTKFPEDLLQKAITEAMLDPGIFFWNLFTLYYKRPPSERLPKYNMDARLMMSAFVFIDLEECLQALQTITDPKPKPPAEDDENASWNSSFVKSDPEIKETKKKSPKKTRKGQQPVKPSPLPDEGLDTRPKSRQCKTYLYKLRVPCILKPHVPFKPRVKPAPIDMAIKLRSDKSFENLAKKTINTSLEQRRNKIYREKPKPRVCEYNFWEPPYDVHASGKTARQNAVARKMFVKKVKALHLVNKQTPDSSQFHVGSVVYCHGKGRYLLHGYIRIATGYVTHSGGMVLLDGQCVIHILGSYKYPKPDDTRCVRCTCTRKWNSTVQRYLRDSKCTCYHRMDMHNEGKTKQKFMYPASKHLPMFFNEARIYDIVGLEKLIRDSVQQAIRSRTESSTATEPLKDIHLIPPKELLKTFLLEIMESNLLLPHLPDVNLLNSLQVWVKNRVCGSVTPKQTKRMLLQSQRDWAALHHIECRARAYQIPWTVDEYKYLNFNHRDMLDAVKNELFESFKARNIKKILELARMAWPTMRHEFYPDDRFLNIFYSYLPSRPHDVHLLGPYDTLKVELRNKTCPLSW